MDGYILRIECYGIGRKVDQQYSFDVFITVKYLTLCMVHETYFKLFVKNCRLNVHCTLVISKE